MTMSVTTPIIPTSVPTDGATATSLGGQSATDGEFADALAGFLDGGPGAGTAEGEATSTDEATTSGLAPDAIVVPGPEMLATAPPLWMASAEIFPTVTTPTVTTTATTASAASPAAVTAAAGVSGQGAQAGLTATGALAAAAVASTDVPTTTGTTTADAPDAAALHVTTAGAAATTTTPATPGMSAPGTPGTPAAGGPAADGVDVQGALAALGLTLIGNDPSATDSGTTTDPGTTAAAGDGVAPTATEPSTGVTIGQASAPTTAGTVTLSATAPAASTPRPVHVAHQFATQLAALTGAPNGVHTMTIQITPDDLGPVQVQVTLTDGVVDMTVLTALEVGRDTITQAAPDLRRYLEAAGLTCNSVEVDLSNDQSSWLTQPDAEQNFEERQPSNGREQAGTPSGDIDDSPRAVAATRSPSSTSSGVDLQM